MADKPILGRSAVKPAKLSLGRSAKSEKPLLSGTTRPHILGSQEATSKNSSSIVTKEQKMVEQYPSAYAATNAVPLPTKVPSGYVFEWDYLQTFSHTELESFIKHEANCRASNDLNERNLTDITSDIATTQREVCYLIKLHGKYYVVEGWRRTTGAIITKAALTFAVLDLDRKLEKDPDYRLPTYINVFELVTKLSAKESHSLRDRGLHFFNYINTHKVTRPQCAEFHGISLTTLNRDLVSAQVSSDWLVIFDSFKDFSRKDFVTLNRIEMSIKAINKDNDAITDAVLESSEIVLKSVKESDEPLSIAQILDLIICPFNEEKKKKKAAAANKPQAIKSFLREFEDDRKAVLIKSGSDLKVELSNLSDKDGEKLTSLIREFLVTI
ncbi:hypothetical protein [Photobacterium damselae]|uniref:ParB/RepB/Spo0J family partition protein n=2 Tax=Photobacterium damselae subsp. damselae TaxID=85581 RepID=A0AAD3WSN6_PHODD|nr:hypothetical protein [Photobacterium damselae]KAB1175558.1 hypothetical protein F6450_18675 [Photobacterium damselae subsp. damselae]MBE8127607.1 hypothetical protein [Photobacterium damselae subsp. piscicida]NVO60610.1 hypothetical protein [Photobacterium damselae subsp. damselae]PSB82400.1 hypothetical protein C5F64_16105 [Photobacterium damselae subsp. damselae]TLS85878.1 hypothetical protein FD720_13925 [Photobacterium damselae subsp. damselae]